MDPVAGMLAVSFGIIGAQASRALVAASDNSSTPSLAQLGITGACIVIGYFMLRRSDGRDRDAQAAESKANSIAIETLQAQLDAATARADKAEARADAADARAAEAHRRLIDLFTTGNIEQA